jgi:hypothetical protein
LIPPVSRLSLVPSRLTFYPSVSGLGVLVQSDTGCSICVEDFVSVVSSLLSYPVKVMVLIFSIVFSIL